MISIGSVCWVTLFGWIGKNSLKKHQMFFKSFSCSQVKKWNIFSDSQITWTSTFQVLESKLQSLSPKVLDLLYKSLKSSNIYRRCWNISSSILYYRFKTFFFTRFTCQKFFNKLLNTFFSIANNTSFNNIIILFSITLFLNFFLFR